METFLLEDFLGREELNLLESLPSIDSKSINRLCMRSRYILEANDKGYNKNNVLQRYTTYMGKMGIALTDQTNIIERYGEQISNILKTEGINTSSKLKISRLADKFWKEMAKATDIMVDYSTDKRFAGMDVNNIHRSVELLFYVLTLSTLLSFILLILGPVGNILTLCIVAPVMEEGAKMISIKGGFAKEFAVVFNVFEFSEYVLMGVNPIVRLAPVAMHLTTTIIQWLNRNPDIVDQISGPEYDRRVKAQMTGHMIGMLIHTLWNGMAIVISFTS